VKRSQEFSAFVSGFEVGKAGSKWETKIACLLFSVHTEAGNHLIAKITSLPWLFRKKISIKDPETKQISLHPDMYGKVAHIAGHEIAQRSYRLSHPKIVKWDRLLIKDQCRYSLADIKIGNHLPLRIVGGMKEGDTYSTS
jgi:hypothetical protein